MVKALRNGTYKALILDAPVLQYIAGSNHDCDLFTVGDVFETFSLALAFPTDFTGPVIDTVTTSLVRLQVWERPAVHGQYCQTSYFPV